MYDKIATVDHMQLCTYLIRNWVPHVSNSHVHLGSSHYLKWLKEWIGKAVLCVGTLFIIIYVFYEQRSYMIYVLFADLRKQEVLWNENLFIKFNLYFWQKHQFCGWESRKNSKMKSLQTAYKSPHNL